MRALVTGGTGKTGTALVTILTDRGVQAIAASRHPAPDGVLFDWADPATFGPALADTEAVYLVPPLLSTDPMPTAGPFLEQADAAGVRRVVLLGSLAVLPDVPGVAELTRAVRKLPESTVLRPSGFMQNFTGNHPLAVGIRNRNEVVTAAGDGRLGWIDAADVAAVAAEALLAPEPVADELVLTGPEALSFGDAAAMIGAATGREIRVREVTVDEQARRYVDLGMPAGFAAALAAVDRDIRHGSEDRVSTTVSDLTGRLPRGFGDFVRGRLDEWGRGRG